MSRPLLALAGAGCLAIAAVLAPAPAPGLALAGAVGRSMGGLRVALVNALFLRAESLRARGRMEEAPSLYATVLELDPGNDAAFDHLAALYAFDVLPEATGPVERLAWWREAWDVAERGLALRPASARLLAREFDLLRLAADDEDLAEPVGDLVGGDPEILAFDRLLAAARESDHLPRKGRGHLLWLAVLTPQAAAERLRHGRPGAERLVAIGREALRVRGDELARMSLPPEFRGAEVAGAAVPDLSRYLRESLVAVEAVAGALAVGAVGEARAAAVGYVREWPEAPLGEPLLEATSR